MTSSKVIKSIYLTQNISNIKYRIASTVEMHSHSLSRFNVIFVGDLTSTKNKDMS